MSNEHTYTIPLLLVHNKIPLKGGLCLSKKNFDDLKAEKFDFLHPKEHLYFEELYYAKRQKSYLLGRYCAKHAIKAFLSEKNQNNFASICIEKGIFEHPVVYHPTSPNIQISISHTDHFGAALAFSEIHPMAIDIETINPTKLSTLQTQLTLTEQTMAANNLYAPKITQLTLLWSIKEALSKTLKSGFMAPFEIFEVSSIIPRTHFMMSEFRNFHQYQAFSFLFADMACSLVYPKRTCLNLNVLTIQEHFNESDNA